MLLPAYGVAYGVNIELTGESELTSGILLVKGQVTGV